jgi:glucosylceramidase
MHITRCLLAVELTVIFSLTSTIRTQELLQNGCFEHGTNATPWDIKVPPYGWHKEGVWGWASWKDSLEAHTGTKYVDAGAWTYGNYGVWYQDVEAGPGQSYLGSVWARIENWEEGGVDPHASLSIEFRDALGRPLRTDRVEVFNGVVRAPNVWNQYVLNTDPAPATAVGARFLLRADARCTAMFDDASVRVVGPEPDIGPNEGAVTIDIDPAQTFQEMDGFGASLTESSAYLLCSRELGEERRHKVMADLFDPNVGIGLSYLRQPMGSSDFRLEGANDCTYEDVPGDFRIDRDQEYIIPLLKEALSLNPRLKIMGSPWSAPAWMKDSGKLAGGRLIDSDRIYDLYAQYFVRYIQAYASEGIMIDAITLQNEPQYEPNDYPGMRMERSDQIRLALRLGRKFWLNDIDTKIVIYDHNWDNPGYPIEVLKDPQARPYIAGTAFHGYAGDVSAQLDMVLAHPDKEIYFTECTGTHCQPHFGDNLMWDTSHLIIRAVRYYARTLVKWNLALNQFGGPKKDGGCSDCRGVVTIDDFTGDVTKEVEYYSLGHASKFVRPGARRIDSTEWPGNDIENVAFINPDGSIVAIVLNPRAAGQDIAVRCQGRSFTYHLPPCSVTTFTWSDAPGAAVEVWMTTADQTKLLQKQMGPRLVPWARMATAVR